MAQTREVKTDKIGVLFGLGYDITWDQLKTKEDLRKWLEHMSDKNWFDNSIRYQFISAVCRKRRWDITEF